MGRRKGTWGEWSYQMQTALHHPSRRIRKAALKKARLMQPTIPAITVLRLPKLIKARRRGALKMG